MTSHAQREVIPRLGDELVFEARLGSARDRSRHRGVPLDRNAVIGGGGPARDEASAYSRRGRTNRPRSRPREHPSCRARTSRPLTRTRLPIKIRSALRERAAALARRLVRRATRGSHAAA